MSSENGTPAPPLDVQRWFNTTKDLSLEEMRGEVIVIEAFQMLCPGCVTTGIPQTKRIQQTFGHRVRVLGLHTVFEHHAAMNEVALEAFLHEYQIGFPVGIDRHEPGENIPETMRRYGLRGTPSLLLIDRAGHLRSNSFGHMSDMEVGASIQQLLDESSCSGGTCSVAG